MECDATILHATGCHYFMGAWVPHGKPRTLLRYAVASVGLAPALETSPYPNKGDRKAERRFAGLESDQFTTKKCSLENKRIQTLATGSCSAIVAAA